MVNPATFPVQRRGPSGPESSSGGGSSDFIAFDNERYFDPNYASGAENGSIAGPFTSWGDWVSSVDTEDAWRIFFPGYPVVPAADQIPLVAGRRLVLEGVFASTDGSYLNDAIVVPDTDDATLVFRRLYLEAVELAGGNFDLHFEWCNVPDLLESASYTGTVYSWHTDFGNDFNLPDATARLTGGSVSTIIVDSLYLTNCQVGAGLSAGVIEAGGSLISCKGVIFNSGSTIEFTGAEGTLLLDGPSYKSFLDEDIVLTNGHVVRDDGSWPVDAISYTSADPNIDFFKNPRAILENDNTAFSCTFNAPLTREVQILIVNAVGGGGVINFPDNVHWSDGLPPELPTGAGEVTLLRFDYEEALDTYYGWCAVMNAQAVAP